MFRKFLLESEDYEIKSSGVNIDSTDLDNGIFNLGNRSKIVNVMRKAMRGEDIVLCCFGGSITAGGSINIEPLSESGIKQTCKPLNYVEQTKVWWDNLFSKYGSKVTMVNAGIGATDTPYGTHRIVEDVLPYYPDLVILDWCCNDNSSKYKQGTYESIIRKLLEKNIAVILFSFDHSFHHGTQFMHEPLSLHYDLPHLSYYDAFGKNEKWEYLTNDRVHPNMVGHTLATLIITHYLSKVYCNIDEIMDKDCPLKSETYHPDADIYNGAYVARIKDILEGKIKGVRIIDMGSFAPDEYEHKFAFKKYLGYVAYSNSIGQFKPLVVEIDKSKTAFLLISRSNGFVNGTFDVFVDDIKVPDSDGTFNCSTVKSVDNIQIEWQYHWATQRIYRYNKGKNVTLKILPTIPAGQEKAYVRLFAILLS